MVRTERTSEPASRVACRRLNVARTTAEHRSCPYCFGEAADVAAGDHGLFCDYQPGIDPVCFGFPDGSERIARG
jgi:hypothetical protein